MGDFNEISHPNETFGGNSPNRTKINTFYEFLNKANLIYLGFVGPKFTWTNGRQPNNIIHSRIDKLLKSRFYLR